MTTKEAEVMTDFQFKAIIEVLIELVKSKDTAEVLKFLEKLIGKDKRDEKGE
jgi:indole-3-glycerol phosphate synthase